MKKFGKNLVVVKIQRPIFPPSDEILSYVVDEDGEQISNPFMETIPREDQALLFGEYYKVYYIAEHRKDGKLELLEPYWEDEWV